MDIHVWRYMNISCFCLCLSFSLIMLFSLSFCPVSLIIYIYIYIYNLCFDGYTCMEIYEYFHVFVSVSLFP